MSAAQEVGPLYTAKLVDLTTGEVFTPPPEADSDQDGIPDNPFVTLKSDNTLWLAEVGEETTGGTRMETIGECFPVSPARLKAAIERRY